MSQLHIGELELVSLADRLDVIPTLAGWMWEEWDRDGGGQLEEWTERLHDRAGQDGLPVTFAAVADGDVVGAASVVEQDLPDKPRFATYSPWLAAVYVHPSARGRGIARALSMKCVDWARENNFAKLYLFTGTAQGLYERLGWKVFDTEEFRGKPLVVMAKALPLLD